MSSGLCLLWHRLIHSHSCFQVQLFQHGFLHWPQYLQRCISFSVALTAIVPSEVNLLQHGCSPSREAPALLWAYPCPHTLSCSSMTLCTATDASKCTCCSMNLSTATDALRCTFFSVDLSHNPFRDCWSRELPCCPCGGARCTSF